METIEEQQKAQQEEGRGKGWHIHIQRRPRNSPVTLKRCMWWAAYLMWVVGTTVVDQVVPNYTLYATVCALLVNSLVQIIIYVFMRCEVTVSRHR